MRLKRDSNPWPPRYSTGCDALPTELWSLVASRSGASSIYTRYMKRMMLSVYDKDHMSDLFHFYSLSKSCQCKAYWETAIDSLNSIHRSPLWLVGRIKVMINNCLYCVPCWWLTYLCRYSLWFSWISKFPMVMMRALVKHAFLLCL